MKKGDKTGHLQVCTDAKSIFDHDTFWFLTWMTPYPEPLLFRARLGQVAPALHDYNVYWIAWYIYRYSGEDGTMRLHSVDWFLSNLLIAEKYHIVSEKGIVDIHDTYYYVWNAMPTYAIYVILVSVHTSSSYYEFKSFLSLPI